MCAIFGALKVPDAAAVTAAGLHNNQHRAIDYAGIVSVLNGGFHSKHGNGVARQIFTKEVLSDLPGQSALGHIRYPTVNDNPLLSNIQPIFGDFHGTTFALAHNGNLTNVPELLERLSPIQLATSMDTELIVRLLEREKARNVEEALLRILPLLKGSYVLGVLTPTSLIAVRGPSGNRPLSIGKINDGFCISSETSALTCIDAREIFDVETGTMVVLDERGITKVCVSSSQEHKCRFESIYYALPSSTVFGESVSRFRLEIGRMLEKRYPVPGADIVTPIPDSSNFMALGFAESGKSGTYLPVIIRSHYMGRSFIVATQTMRDSAVSQKFSFTVDQIKGKKIVVVDDSIVRGTTLPKIVRKLRGFGAKEIHVRIGSPPIKAPCRYGINTPTHEELIAASHTTEEIRSQTEADSLEYLGLDQLMQLSPNPHTFCYACMNGEYW